MDQKKSSLANVNGRDSSIYIDIALFADSVSLVLQCFLKNKETYELPQSVLEEALNFLKEATNGNTLRSGRYALKENNAVYLQPSYLLSDIFVLLKKKNPTAFYRTFEDFCQESIETLQNLLVKSQKVGTREAENLKNLFDALGSIASERIPTYTDMGGYCIITH